MNNLRKLFLGALVTGVSAFAANSDPAVVQTDPLTQQVMHQIRMYPNFSVFDDVKVRVDNGNVELIGEVTQPYKKSDLNRIVAHTPGVTAVTNDVKVLPLSNFDNRIRVQTARAIFRDPVLSKYGIQAVPPIHIIVDNGHITLEGVVNTEMEKNVAGIRASGASLSFGPVINNLRVENPTHKS
jgi:hyperosmotically inducible protein